MTGRVAGKVAVVTGAGRGQGRSHAVALAEEGADIIAIDYAGGVATTPYALATAADLEETAGQVRALGRRAHTAQADVRDIDGLSAAVADGVAELGRLDIACLNAGIVSYNKAVDITADQWQDMIDVNLTGVFNGFKAAIPHILSGGKGGSIIMISSALGVRGKKFLAHYAAAKHGVIGLMRSLAIELGPDSIRVNCVNPGGVDTIMLTNPAFLELLAPDLPPAERTREVVADRIRGALALPVPWVDPRDISNAVVFLASDDARYVTGIALQVDGGSGVL